MDRLYQNGEYLERNPTWHAEDSGWKAAQVVRLLERRELCPNTVCEVGCGAGDILVNLHRLLPDNVQFSGYEISPQAHAICLQKATPRLHFHHADVTNDLNAFFDLLLVLDVVEHVEDYFGFLRRLKTKATWKLFHVPLELTFHRVLRGSPLMATRSAFGHLHYFTKETLFAALEETGHRIVDYAYTDLSTSPDSLQHRTLGTRLVKAARRACFSSLPDFTARVLGGYSILVLTT